MRLETAKPIVLQASANKVKFTSTFREKILPSPSYAEETDIPAVDRHDDNDLRFMLN